MSPACRDNNRATRMPGQIRLWITAAVPSNSPRLDGMSLNTSQPFTRAEALAAGLTDVDLRSRHFQRLFHGLYLRSGIKIGVQQMAAAALHISPRGSYASHQTAAALWGASIGDLDDVLSAFRKDRRDRNGVASWRIARRLTRIRAFAKDSLFPNPPASSWS
jgi:hypothetical protein